MVQLLEELPPELQAHIAGTLDDAAAAGRWAQASRASRLLLLPRLDQLLEVRRSARQQAVHDKHTSSTAHAVAQLPPSRSTIWAMVMLQFMCYRTIWTVTFARAALLVMCGRSATALAVSMCSGISLPRRIGQATDGTFMVWALPRPPGARLRRERPNLLTCSREQQAYSRHSTYVDDCIICCRKSCCRACIIVL